MSVKIYIFDKIPKHHNCKSKGPIMLIYFHVSLRGSKLSSRKYPTSYYLRFQMRPDDEEFINWWNFGVKRFICSGKRYEDFCKSLDLKYSMYMFTFI